MQNENILNCGLHLGYNFKRNCNETFEGNLIDSFDEKTFWHSEEGG